MNSHDNIFGEVIYSYTRKQAIADGVLVDLSSNDVARQHWKFPLACTDTVWAIFEDAIDHHSHDLSGIINDVSVTAKLAAHGSQDSSNLVFFETLIAGSTHRLKLHIGPGDSGEPVLTLMLPNED